MRVALSLCPRLRGSASACLLALALSAGGPDGGTSAAPPADRARALAQLRAGLTPDAVRKLLGPPTHVCRQILYHRYREQWIYDHPRPLRLDFDCVLGQQPVLLPPPVPARVFPG